MCNPAAFAAAQSVSTYITDSQNASAANKQSARNFRRTTELVGRQTVLKQHSVQQEQIQLAKRATEEVDAISTEADRAFSLNRISAGEGGVAGSGVGQVLADFRAQEAKSALTTIRNLEFSDSAAESELEAINLTAESTLENALPTEVEGGSLLQLALGLGGAAAGGAADSVKNQLDAGRSASEVQLSFKDIFLNGAADY